MKSTRILVIEDNKQIAALFLPVVSVRWLFRYRGLLVSIALNGVIFSLAYLFLLQDKLSPFQEMGTLGFGGALGLCLLIYWLRTRVRFVHRAQKLPLAADQESLPVLQAESYKTLDNEHQRHLNELKDQFLLNVSHELRTPLTLLGGSLELLDQHYEQLDSTERALLLKDMRVGQEELLDLVNRILDTAAIVSEVPQAKPKVVCVHQLLQEVLAHLTPIQAYTICLQVPEQLMVWADPQFLHQVLQNLLSNVCKYVPTQTEIHIEAAQSSSSSPVCLSVQDAGPGIPAEELPLLFEKFVRLRRDLTGSTRGTGLGLYICKQLVEAMSGQIWVESSGRMGEGSRFCFVLPSLPPSSFP